MATEFRNSIPSQVNRLNNGERDYVLRNKNGDVIPGGNALIPKGDFGHFLGWKEMSKEEKSGEKSMSPGRVIEVALRREINELGESAMRNASVHRNIWISDTALSNLPGRERDMVLENIDAIRRSTESHEGSTIKPGMLGESASPQYMLQFAEKARQDNYRYLEVQYRADWASKSTMMISTMIKARHDAIRKSVGEIR